MINYDGYAESQETINDRWARWRVGGYGWFPKTDAERQQVEELKAHPVDEAYALEQPSEAEQQAAQVRTDTEWLDTDEPTSLKERKQRILDAFAQEPLSKAEAAELHHELLEIDDHLGYYDFTPTPSDMPVIDMDNIQEIEF